MRTVRDGDGRECILVERGSETSRVYDPAAGETRTLPTANVEASDADPLSVTARSVPPEARTLLRSVATDAGLGLLVDLDERGPRGVREMLDAYGLCESDLHGTLAEFRVAGLVEETTVDGRRGYRVTEEASAALALLGAGPETP